MSEHDNADSSRELAWLRHPQVRDLAWLLQAPDLLSTPFPGRPSLMALGLADPDGRRAWLSDLEGRPQALEAMTGPRLTGRLGHYHEVLWHFLLDNAPGTRLLAHNLPVRDDKRTLGEIDVLYTARNDPQPIHLELAIKYYLGLPQGPGAPDSQARWIGPGCADSLAIKRQRTIVSQLPLSHTHEARAVLKPYTEQTPLQHLAMPGTLFHPWSADRAGALPPPREATPHALTGDWLHIADWHAYLDGRQHWRGAFLNKPYWLAPPREETLQQTPALTRALRAHFAQRWTPRQLALRDPAGRWRRVFVVDNAWPAVIPLPR
ncbi:hypothetical protein DFO67_101218 [Modicisalibacter xianhensis]|uniref:DUF1853 family protein n=1 Tax=Modicisalibacter xianhensis TaxID=442341 RepID=A0A4R8GBB5_9GAMM|nr:DUF1853 family protein [Halomonas xianhensis]TDX32924.1 hypothetical protein DFO67_101218 [Halomonas xianhensis]